MKDKYADVDSSVEKTHNCVSFVTFLGSILPIIWMCVRIKDVVLMPIEAEAKGKAYLFILSYGLGMLISLWVWRRFADLMIRNLEMTKLTAKNTSEMVKIMRAQDNTE